MHYLGFVFVDQPTKEAVAEAMEDHKDTKWDWYRCGGRWDGYFGGDEEMARRATDNSFNFQPRNDDASTNFCKVSELPADKRPHFFVVDYCFVPKEYYNEYEKSPHGDFYGAILPTPHWEERWQAALVKHADKFVVVVDAHN